MNIQLPFEILASVLRFRLEEILADIDHQRSYQLYGSARRSSKEALDLLLVSKFTSEALEHILYRRITEPSDDHVRVLCRKMITRPSLAHQVEEITLGEGLHEDQEEEQEGGTAVTTPAETLERKFQSDTKYSRALGRNDLETLKRPTIFAAKWVLLLQLPNLRTLTLRAHTGKFANMALLLRLPRLEKLDFSIKVPCPESDYALHSNDVPAVEVLASILSSTTKLTWLKWEDMSGSSSHPVKQKVFRVKHILDQHAANTLQHLSICFSNSCEVRLGGDKELCHTQGHFGSMHNFTKLETLEIQLEVLLGSAADSRWRLRDVLPLQLRHFNGLALPGYYGLDDLRAWGPEHYTPQLYDLKAAIAQGENVAKLASAAMQMRSGMRFVFWREDR
ncbi:hypothetical protein BJX64DRAFT_261504 [Aspergillus heterothallicus]